MYPIALGGLALLALLTFAPTTGPTPAAPEPGAPPTAEPTIDTEAVLDAYVDALASQSANPAELKSLVKAVLVLKPSFPGEYAAVLVPCDQEVGTLLPSPQLLTRVSGALSNSYGVDTASYALQWGNAGPGPLQMCAIVFYHAGTPAPTQAEIIERFSKRLSEATNQASQYGAQEAFGILDLIVQSVVASAVGTVTSMGVQDLVHAAGGERKLARLMRRYKKVRAHEGSARARRLLRKIQKTASRIKGRHVDWSEIEALMAEAE